MLVDTAAVAFDREVRFGNFSYPFRLRSGPSSWTELASELSALNADRFLVITDTGVPPSAVSIVSSSLETLAPVTVLEVAANEKSKTIAAIDELSERAFGSRATRRSVFVALGGGLAGNIAGLLAHLFMRGARLVHIPTTLLAMSDSVLSFKQAVNSRVGKNHLGAFHVPELVWAHLDFLASLPPAETRSALCEAIKNVMAICPEVYDDMAARLRPEADYSPAELSWFIGMCVDAKQRVMEADPFEKGRALILEYGHTVGHAAELVSGGAFGHGLAIGVGGLVAARVATSLGFGDPDLESAHEALLSLNGAPTMFPAYLSPGQFIEAVRLDNKRGYIPHQPGHVDMVLLDGPGRPHQTGGSFITQVPEDVVMAAIHNRFSQPIPSEVKK
jgi:3-dehydroquinate synthase/2-deoxy-scyllo-inosose synthase